MSNPLKIWSIDDTPLTIGCGTTILLPIVYDLFSEYFTVQLDNGTYVQGTFVDPSTQTTSNTVRLTLESTIQEAILLDRFMMLNDTFYIQTDNLDIFLSGSKGERKLVRRVSFDVKPRNAVNLFQFSLDIEEVI